jgi:hypothetical protein
MPPERPETDRRLRYEVEAAVLCSRDQPRSNIVENPTNPPSIRIVLDDETAQGHYVNFANIIHSPSEFIIDLGRAVPGKNEVKVYSRVIMTPLHAKQFLQALSQNVGMFEQKFGAIRLDAADQSFQNEPSN